MSAIFGLVGLRGCVVDRRELDDMSASLAAHGLAGNVWWHPAAGVGQRLKAVTPEDDWESQPLRSQDGLRVLVSDGRIDNRAELTELLGLGRVVGVPDSAFIMRAYETWGLDCATHLVGAFTFALWDVPLRSLILVRSPMGERPLFYHQGADRFVFATAPSGLFVVSGVPRALDEQVLADHLARERIDPDATWYRGVRRLVPGHTMVVTPDRTSSHAHWRFQPERELRLTRDEDYVEAFDALFTRVVADHTRSARPVGLMLSGGYDSSSVAAAAAPLLARRGRRLVTFTEVPRSGFDGAVPAGRYADETPFVRATAAMHPNVTVNLIETPGRFFLENLASLFDATETVFPNASNHVWYEAILEEAQRQGLGVVLTGGRGNHTISWAGAGRLPQLCRAGHWSDAFREAHAMHGGRSRVAAIRTVFGHGIMPILPTGAYLGIGRALHPTDQVEWSSRPWRAAAVVNTAFATTHRVNERARATPDHRLRMRADTRELRYLNVAHHSRVVEGVDAGYLARFDVDTRDPTGDLRLVEFCLSLPEDQYLRDGERRRLVRRWMRTRVPSVVLENPGRGLQAADWRERMTGARERIASVLVDLEQSPLACRAIDLDRLRQLVRRVSIGESRASGRDKDFQAVELGLMTGSFIRWFETAAHRETPP